MKYLYSQLLELISHKSKEKTILLIDSKNEIVKPDVIEMNSLTIAKQRNSKNGVFISKKGKKGRKTPLYGEW